MGRVKDLNMRHRYFYFFIISLFFIKIEAQETIDSINVYFHNKEYDKTIKFSVKNGYYYLLIEKGIILFNDNDFINCISFISNAYHLNENSNDEIEKISLLNILGICYEKIYDFDNAEKHYKKAINLNTLYTDEYFKSLNLLYNLYSVKKDFAIAEKQCKLFLDEAKLHKGENSKEYLLALNQLTLFYLSNDSYNLAEEYCLKFIEVNKFIFGDKSEEYLDAFSIYINLLMREGKLILAEKYSSDLLKIYLNLEKENYKQKALHYNQLATIQQNLYKYDLAKSNFQKAIELIEKNYGTDNLYYALSIENLGVLNINLNDFTEAEFLLKKALEIKEKLQDSNIDTIYANLAAVYQKTNRCEEAEKYQLKSIENVKNKFSETYKTKILGLAITYFCLKDPHKEFDNLLSISNILKKNIFGITAYMSRNEIQQYIQMYFHHRIYPLSFLIRNPFKFEKLNISCFEEELMFKNLTINNYKSLQNSIRNSKSEELKLNYTKFIDNQKEITRLNESSNKEKLEGYENLILDTERLEKYLVQQSEEFSKSRNLLSLKWEQLQRKLNPSETVIDIVDFTYFNNYKPDSILYSAFILKKDSKFPQFIPLFEEKQLNTILEQNKNLSDRSKIDINYQEKALSNLLLKPLENELKGISTIYLSLSGLTHQINVAALPVNENQTFGQKYKIHILNSPSELIDYTATSFDKKEKLDFILYGGIDYDKKNNISSQSMPTDRNLIHVDEEIMALQTRSGISSFGYLLGTKNEIENIRTLANKSNLNAVIFEDKNATEESIKQLDGRATPFVLHLATHGFFFPDPVIESSNDKLFFEGKSKIFKSSDDPMMRSGLVFSGANKSWGKSNENQAEDDGILTAKEISNLDLSACQLVVLSACETGLGEVKGSEGVFGLQRAFKMAGVKNIIMSLWKVPDTQTAELFNIFYSECFAGKTIHEAFKIAQSIMKEKYSPYYWAGFVLLE